MTTAISSGRTLFAKYLMKNLPLALVTNKMGVFIIDSMVGYLSCPNPVRSALKRW